MKRSHSGGSILQPCNFQHARQPPCYAATQGATSFINYKLNRIVLFPYLVKYYNVLFLIIIFWLGCDRPSGLVFFVPVLLLSILTPLFLPSSSVSLSYFVLAVPMLECSGKHSCMSAPFAIAILNCTCFFPTVQLQVHNVYSKLKTRNSYALVTLCF